VKINNFKN